MKKLLMAVFISFVLICSMSAEERQFFLSLEPLFALENGNITETAYRSATDSKYSEIEWKKDMNLRLGAGLEAGWRFVSLDSTFLFGLPKASKSMTESIWSNASAPNTIIDKFDCDNNLISDFEIKSRLKFEIKPVRILRIYPYVGFSYRLTNFEASDALGRTGHKKNVPYDSPETEEYKKNGVQVNYKRETYDLFVGLSAGVYLFDRLSLLADFNASPFIKVNSVDHHCSSGVYYLDVMNSAFKKFEVGATAEYRIWQGLSAGVNFKYNLLNEITGDEYKSATDSNYSYNTGYSAGTSESNWQLEIFAKYRFDFGPVYVPKIREAKARKPRVRHGKVEVIQY